MKNVYNFLKQSGTFFIATCEGGQPHVRAFGAVCIYKDKLFIATTNQKPVFRQITQNPKIEICALGDNNTWLRIAATAKVDDCREARILMLDENPELKQMYRADDGIFEVLFLQNAVASFCSYTTEPKETYF